MTKYLTQNSRFALRTIMVLGLGVLCAAVLSLAGIFLYLDPQIPKPETYRNVKLETPLRIFAENGELLAEFGERRLIPVTLDQVPQHFIDALLDTEDKRFYQHSGIDFISLANDALSLVGTFVTEGELGGGASTITMQLARNVSFSLERRFLRKFKEMLLALKIERELSKAQILELYINIVPFGKRAYGAEAAARTYYGKSLLELNLPQLAMLAGIPQAPTAGNPINGPERALARRNLVLSRMLAQESISQREYEAAKAAPISARIYARDLDVPSPFAAEWVRQQAASLLPDLYTGGYEIYTTIHADKQAQAIAALRRGLLNYDQRHGYRGAEGRADEVLLEQLQSAADIVLPIQSEAADSESTVAQPTSPASEYPNSITAAINEALKDLGTYGGLPPAMVVAITDTQAVVQLDGGEQVVIELEDTSWARQYIHVDRRGPPITSLKEVVQIGDIVRLYNDGKRWLFAQLPEIQGALISMDPATGAVRAIVGGFDFYRNQYNHALQAARQPGSGFKPFVYSAALAAGVTPADLFMDAPLVFDDENLESQYRPDNDNNRYNGPTRLREALYRSINLVSMRVMLNIGAGHVLDHVAKFGFETKNFPRNTQLAIGGGTMAVTPLEMARAYAVFANSGYLIDPYIVKRIVDADGNEIFRANHPIVCRSCEREKSIAEALSAQAEPTSLEELLADAPTSTDQAEPLDLDNPEFETLEITSEDSSNSEANGPAEVADGIAGEMAGEMTDETSAQSDARTSGPPEPILAERVIDERNTFIMHSMLQDVVRRGTGVSARRMKRGDIAGKTGTTNDAADTWFNGYNPDLVTTVWVGFSNHDPLGARAFGSNTPLPIWIDYMEKALNGTAERFPPQPPGVVTMKIDPETGEVAGPRQRNALFEYFLREYAPEIKRTVEPDQPERREDDINAIDIFGG